MNSLKLYPIIIFSVSACAGTPVHVDLTVFDGDGQPVVNAVVGMDFLLSHGSNGFEGNTNAEGKVETTNLASFGVGILIQKDGFYPTEYRLGYGDQKLTALLREKKNPIAMYAKHIIRTVEKRDVSYGFDFLVGDFVLPFGKGRHADILIKFSRQFTDYNNYREDLNLMFPNEFDGLRKSRLVRGREVSSFKSDYVVSTDDFINEMTFTSAKKDGTILGSNNKNESLYLRVRSIVVDDELVSAHYCKVFPGVDMYGAFIDSPGVKFTYHCNPTPNDRNVEFDPTKNIFKNLKPEETVREP